MTRPLVALVAVFLASSQGPATAAPIELIELERSLFERFIDGDTGYATDTEDVAPDDGPFELVLTGRSQMSSVSPTRVEIDLWGEGDANDKEDEWRRRADFRLVFVLSEATTFRVVGEASGENPQPGLYSTGHLSIERVTEEGARIETEFVVWTECHRLLFDEILDLEAGRYEIEASAEGDGAFNFQVGYGGGMASVDAVFEAVPEPHVAGLQLAVMTLLGGLQARSSRRVCAQAK